MRRWVWGSLWVITILNSSIPAKCEDSRRDRHSFSNPEAVRVRHLDLHLDVDFGAKSLTGSATLTFQRMEGVPADVPLLLDTRDLTVEKVEASPGDETVDATFQAEGVTWSLGNKDPILGQALSISLPPNANRVKISYKTAPTSTALQWVQPSGTAGKTYPFLYSQSQAIHARSWIPCQDSPGVRVSSSASIRVLDPEAHKGADGPSPLTPLMSAQTLSIMGGNPGYTTGRFRMTHAVPPYLIALAVGNLVVKKTGERTGVWAEPSVIEQAAWEFADTEKMIEAAEKRFGPYRWDRYDILVLPPSFPFGGMENPMLTFATPTVLTGDRSQVALVAHELAHSWSGNLVTNATWSDFWLNEGFTVYLERRIVEDVFGKQRAEMEAVLGRQELDEAIRQLPPADQILHVNLDGRDPDTAITAIPYEKGALFLKAVENKVGQDRMDAFLRGYFDHFAFQSITTSDFEAYLRQNLFEGKQPPIDLHAWLYEPGLPAGAPQPTSTRFSEIEAEASAWLEGRKPANAMVVKGWSTLEWLHFLRAVPDDVSVEKMGELDKIFGLTQSKNAEILTLWLEKAIKRGYHPADQRVAEFLGSVGRRKFLVPLYQALLNAPGGRKRAQAIFEKARPTYHPIAADSIGKLLEEPR